MYYRHDADGEASMAKRFGGGEQADGEPATANCPISICKK